VAKTAGVLIGLGVLGATAAAVVAQEPFSDPDLPIATARYGDAPVVLAGGPTFVYLPPTPEAQAPVLAETAPPPAPIMVAELAPAAMKPTPRAGRAQPRLQARLTSISYEASPAPAASRPPPAAVRSLSAGSRSLVAPRQGSSMLDGQALLRRIAPHPNDLAKVRWVAYVAGSDTAFALNLVRDSVDGVRRAGWSVEDLAEYGKAQIGLGWRRKQTQISLAATHREFSKIGITKRDVVLGVNFSIKSSAPR